MVGFRDEKIDGDKMIITQGVIEKYYNRNEIIEYSDQLKPNETEKIKAQAGLRYTTSFKHPFGKGIIKEAIPPKIKTSIYEYFEPEIKETSITVEDATKLSSSIKKNVLTQQNQLMKCENQLKMISILKKLRFYQNLCTTCTFTICQLTLL